MVHGSQFMVHGEKFMVPGSQFMVHGSWFMVHGSWGAVRTSVTLLVQDIGNTVTVLVHGLNLSSANSKWRPDLSIIAPGRWAARMPGTGTLRRSSAPARKKAIVGKSRVAASAPTGVSWFS
jgi:hypothetical protein